MFTNYILFRPIDDYTPDAFKHEYETFEEARQDGRRYSCMAGVTDVTVRDKEGIILSSYNQISGYWFDFTDEAGNFISRDKYFEKLRKRVEGKSSLNIRIRHQGLHWRVLAGEHSIPIDPEMLPWISDAVQEAETKNDWREEDGLEPMSAKEEMDIFADYLITQIVKGLKRSPSCYSRVRYEEPYKSLLT
jgi:hypothetical protein